MINYYLITKPGIIAGNLITLFAGYLLASKGQLNYPLLIATLIGIIFIVASACIFNNYIDRDLDKLMDRTKKRATARGTIGKKEAMIFAFSTCLIANLVLLFGTNLLTLFLADLGLFIYVCLYSMWKGHTIYGTAIGSLAGALPPVIGYTAVTNRIDLPALILFVMLVMWQMPHFFSIAIMHLEDYTRGKIPVLPVEKGLKKTLNHMLIYIAGFTATLVLLTYFSDIGPWFLYISLTIGLFWFALCLYGYKSSTPKVWAKGMFRLSLVMINAVCFGIFLNFYYA